MTRFAVHYSYGPEEQQAQHRPEHRAYLSSLLEQGSLLASGPYTDDSAAGALLIVEAEDSAAVQALLDQDPMMIHGVVTAHEIREWNVVLGSVGS